MSKNIPAYVFELWRHTRVAPMTAQVEGAHGYVYRVYRKDNKRQWHTHEKLVSAMVAFAQRNGADARIVDKRQYTDKEHRKPEYKRDFIDIVMTDPAANVFDKFHETYMAAGYWEAVEQISGKGEPA